MKPKPLSRQELLPLLVTDADAFTVQRYLCHREAVPRLPELEEQGQEVLPGPEGVLADLYYSLWDPEPRVKEEGEIPPDRRYWQELLGQTVQTAAYQELHAATQLKELQSVLGTIAMGESVLALVPKEDQQKLQELAEAQRQADQLGQQAASAQAQANAAQQLAQAAAQAASQAAEQAQQQPDNAQAQEAAAKAQAMAQQLAQQAQQAQAEAEAARLSHEQAKALANELAERLMGKPGSAEEKRCQLRRIGLRAVEKAQAEVKEISENIQAWGLEPGELTRESFAEVQAILERVKRNPALKKFTALLGRLRQIAARKARSKTEGEGVRMMTTETGRDLKRAVPAELVALTHPALRVKAQMRWMRGELRLRGQRTRRKLGYGPVVVCEDASGSMDGVKQQWTKALVLALAHFAKLQKRSFGWILFDAMVHLAKVYPRGVLSAKDRLEIAESRAGGGTDFESPLRRAIEMIQKEGLKKADILLVTDGMCAVSDKFLKELLAVKRALEVNIYTVLVNVGETTDATVKEFSDRVIPISDLSAEEAERKVIGIL
jgi:uncharacterized protein with von Willebrand factor type A (vWA) domain